MTAEDIRQIKSAWKDYWMAYNRIGVARLDLPDSLPPGKAADRQESKV